jgi:tRNA nucleotidyltransferase (CCA-adding enzyme)
VAQAPGTPEKASQAELFAHGADVGVRGIGPTREAAFEQAAVALTMAVTDPAEIVPRSVVDIACEAPDDDLLLVDWLNALIYEMAVRHWVFSSFDVSISGQRLKARAWGESIDQTRHRLAAEPKGATFTELKVATRADGAWLAQCVVDV